MVVLKIENLAFSWSPTHATRIQIPHFEVKTGESVCLYGTSGSGKSTLLQLLSGALLPQQGKITVVGQEISALSEGERNRLRSCKMGIIFQQFNLVPYLSVLDNIILPLRFSNHVLLRDRRALHERVCSLLKRLGLSPQELLDQPVDQLSVGQQQRVAAARAFVAGAELILADEPTSALDPDSAHLFFDLMFAEARSSGASIVCVSHDPSVRSLFSKSVPVSDLTCSSL
ncbi:MAG: ATP-binding cassette domain-containing protein [Zetaproteobacteria bacterium]|nr:ATP-binding cassette domain-containing protein [Zetaproteobacteria bacterium]